MRKIAKGTNLKYLHKIYETQFHKDIFIAKMVSSGIDIRTLSDELIVSKCFKRLR